jgi:hypothetical protein
VLGLARLAMRVQLLGNGANLGLQRVGAIGEREGIETARFHVDRIIALPKPATSA